MKKKRGRPTKKEQLKRLKALNNIISQPTDDVVVRFNNMLNDFQRKETIIIIDHIRNVILPGLEGNL